ncbi:MAG: glycosyltransferase family 1 protein [Candidatus Saccharimonadales bacterium]
MRNEVKLYFEASSIVDNNKTGIGYFASNLIKSIYKNQKTIGFFFDLFGRNNYSLDDGLEKFSIKYIPAKLLSFIARTTGLQPPIELLIPNINKNDWIFYPNYISYPSIKKVRCIVTIHDLAYLDLPETVDDKNRMLLKKIVPKSIQRASIILCISEFTKQRLLHYFPDAKHKEILVLGIPPVINIKNSSSPMTILNKLGLQARNYMLSVGTIEPRKNIEQAVDSYIMLKDSVRQNFKFVLLGRVGWKSDNVINKINNYNKNHPKNPIIVTGYVSDAEKNQLYLNAKFFVLPSIYEGFGMPLLEAMVYRLPCIVNNIPVFHEIAGQSVEYYNSTKDLSDRMSSHINTRYKRVSYKKILSMYNWDIYAKNILKSMKSYGSKV